MKIYRPLWNEGALLSPQQFQQQAEWESFRSAGVAALASPFTWGVEKIGFNDSLLASGLIQISQLRLWLEDGTLLDAQSSDLPPPPRELDPDQLAGIDAVTVVIALPHMQPGVINVEQEGVAADRPLRYREEWVSVQDAFGLEEESMAVARFNYTIRFAHENNDAWKVCPVAKLIRDGQNTWRQDPSYIPPVALFSASPVLHERLVLLNRQLRSRRQRLMTMRRESNERLADFAVADVSLFWLLNALNSHARVLTEYERFPARPPEQVWAELARLAGSMLTFSLSHDLDAIPGYDHAEPANAFPPLFDLVTELLEASLPSRVIALDMSRPDGQTWKANLHDIRLREEADLYLSVRSDTRVKRGPSGLYDTWLILGGHSFELEQLSEKPESLSMRITGTNGQLPRKALESTLLDRVVKAGKVPVRVLNVTAPTMPLYPPANDRFHWRVMSHLGSNFLSMMDNPEVLRGTLALYDWTDDEMNRRRLEAIVAVKHTLIRRFEKGFMLRGVDIEVTLNMDNFAGEGDVNLFGEMLHRFFALYADIHLFNQLTLVLQPTGKRLRWRENHSQHVPG